ncbi:MAG: VCBS repeat-containing protein, partial [Deltaproteobacteria bacterium]|nr:VCBS repeat-containing protein [Deltaproteobacteria bacterium]
MNRIVATSHTVPMIAIILLTAGPAAARNVSFSESLIGTPNQINGTWPADIDGDGDLDVVAIDYSNSDILWYENVNGDGSSWQQMTIEPSQVGLSSVTAADMDRDGDLDVVI